MLLVIRKSKLWSEAWDLQPCALVSRKGYTKGLLTLRDYAYTVELSYRSLKDEFWRTSI